MKIQLKSVNEGIYTVEVYREFGTKDTRHFSEAGLEEYLELVAGYCEFKGYEFIYDDSILNQTPVDEISEDCDGIEFYLSVEPSYIEPTDGRDKNDAVLFQMGQYPDGKHEIDSVVSASVKHARAFAQAILTLCDEIEK